MNGFSKNGKGACPQDFLDLVSKEKDWLGLTLAPPGDGEHWSTPKHHQEIKTTCNGDESHLSLRHEVMKTQITSSNDEQPVDTKPWPSTAKFLQLSSNAATQKKDFPVVNKESLLHCNSIIMAGLETRNNSAAEKQGFSPSVTVVPNTITSQSQKRAASAQVVGWPPIRSFRKNLASTSTIKTPGPESQNATHNRVTNHAKTATEAPPTSTRKGLYVKVNMEGIPIGRKVDLNAYDSYEQLSSAIDQLFRALLAAQSDTFANGICCKKEDENPITGLLDGSGDYTLVYEDNEGDRVLVGDVPWCMFVSSVKRLRVLKTSDLESMSLGSKKQKMQQSSPSPR